MTVTMRIRESEPGGAADIILVTMTGKLFGSAVGVASASAALVRHVLWYVSYQLDGSGSARVDRTGKKLRSRSR